MKRKLRKILVLDEACFPKKSYLYKEIYATYNAQNEYITPLEPCREAFLKEAKSNGYRLIFLKEADLTTNKLKFLNLNKFCLCKGTARFVRKFMELTGINPPTNVDVPVEFREPFKGYPKGYANRKIWETTLGEVRRQYDANPKRKIFVKSLNDHKVFSGGLFTDEDPMNFLFCKPNEYKLLAQEDLKSSPWMETRFIVVDGKVYNPFTNVDGLHYLYSFEYKKRILEKTKRMQRRMVTKVQKMIDCWNVDVHGAYIIDAAWTNRKEKDVMIIEVNEVWSAGGWPTTQESASVFLKAMETRWLQMINK